MIPILERLEQRLYEARAKAEAANNTVRQLEASIQNLKFLDLSDLKSLPIARALGVIATNEQNGFLSTEMASQILFGLGCFKTLRNAQTSISSVLSRSKHWRHIGHGIWKYEPKD